MNIRFATLNDAEMIGSCDKHIDRQEMIYSIQRNRIYIGEENRTFIGWLRYNLFWDAIPFMNMLYIFQDHRGKGYGKQLVAYWEQEMKKACHDIVMTSTLSNENAQHFYYKLGYRAIGGFVLESEPLEIMLSKHL